MKIVMILAMVVLVMSFTGPISPQEIQAPALEQCRVDIASWTRDFSYIQAADADSLLTSHELTDRINTLKKCSFLEAKEPYRGAISVLETRYGGLLQDRLFDFLVRHNLNEQFQKEDADGLR